MAKKRKEAEEYMIKYVEKMLPGGGMDKLYRDMFGRMNDQEFDTFMSDLESGRAVLPIISPNFGDVQLTTERNIEVAEELGHNFFQRLWIKEDNDLPAYLTNDPYLVVDWPLRRQAQMLTKKISVTEHSQSIDDFSGQPSGDSRGSGVSYPEIQILRAQGLEKNLREILKYRGGDERGFAAMSASISRTGGVSTASLDKLGTQVKSTQTLSTLLTCMHLANRGLIN